MALEGLGIEQQAMGVDGIDMRLAADEGHVMAGLQEQASVIAPDRSGADDRDLHVVLRD
jgi:hypothetical protein